VPSASPARARPRRLAAIDIGSNSIHMVVVAADAEGGYRVLDRERDMVRLGRSALGSGRLSEKAMRRGLTALARMSTLARLKGATRTVAVATSAVREAENGDEFLARVRVRTGLAVRVLSGDEEARLIFRAVREAVDLGRGSSVVIDVGGGSTEWITARRGELGRAVSVKLGSLRLTGRLAGDPPSRAAIDKLRRHIRAAIERLPVPKRLGRVVATSGTAVCCADLVGFLAGEDWKASAAALREVRLRELETLVDHLRRLERDQIAALAPVGKPRSESILAGAVLLEELVRHAGVKRFFVSDRALREGVVLDALGKPLASPREPEAVRRRQILALAARGETVYGHAVETARLALRLFDATAAVHGMGPPEREWLEYAALLHDLGYVVDYEQHHKHGYYLVTSAPLDAFDQREIEILANVVRFHRGPLPARRHASFRDLKAWQQRTIEKLAALLRVADALDRSHAHRVKEIYASVRKRRVRLEILSPWDVSLELDSVRDRAGAFRQVFGRDLTARRGLAKGRRPGKAKSVTLKLEVKGGTRRPTSRSPSRSRSRAARPSRSRSTR
jgi:exopolyphosphatase/guanosine-5'-triphosphate,3'-diphosphate pyrophosphatase